MIVYYVGESFRNNLGNWTTQNIKCDVKKRDFHFFACKDLAMSKEANYGFMLWDGISKGTINNAVNLLREDKKVLIFQMKNRNFVSLKEFKDLRNLLRASPFDIKEKLITDLKFRELFDEITQQSLVYS